MMKGLRHLWNWLLFSKITTKESIKVATSLAYARDMKRLIIYHLKKKIVNFQYRKKAWAYKFVSCII